MKQTIIILVITFVAYIQCSSDPVGEICNWQTKRNNLISQLTTQGQQTANQILVDLQKVTFAGIQPVYAYISTQVKKEINQINSTSDASKLILLGSIYGVGNSSAGVGPLRDSCQDAKNVAAVYSSFSKQNQAAAMKIIDAINTGIVTAFPIFAAINNFQDASLITQLQKTENMTILIQLAQLYTGDNKF